MGARPDRSSGDLECCGRLLRLLAFVFFLVCACLVMAMVATDGGASLVGSSSNAATSVAAAMATGGSPAWRSGGRGGMAGADAFRSSERRIPKGPDPIHNRRAGKTTIAPRRRD
ncbi:hypothetical protein BDA96_09G200700 [Sorghum bicolor]|uniref:Uncharacterized protein n=2 Tax=Sorghum bicolor TaxID=4558 RepID=A0A1B6P989_SORBI|nr:uncharacterized protein LOC110430523 [Sorghum bicolor]KAG0518715.1 hypothetical protein BDA96_09G200700 [Sorghum bicolor]KXG22299.1 hypothetical protein SORBI_3009G189900 [Sorghum bicolor]|eukprot:XP_021303941.1 uncharacterized protein LOC110430523 [Sorghum bicolor]